MVLAPVLYNNSNPNTLIHIFRLSREINHHPRTSAQPCSRPGKHPPNRAPVRLFSRPREHPPSAQITNRASARLYSRTRKHPPTAHLHSHTVWLPQGFGSLPNGKPPTRRICSSLYGLSFPARAGIPLLVAGSNPLSGL